MRVLTRPDGQKDKHVAQGTTKHTKSSLSKEQGTALINNIFVTTILVDTLVLSVCFTNSKKAFSVASVTQF